MFPPELVGYSLAQQANPGADDPDCLLYYIHDIVLDYLKDTIPERKQVCSAPVVVVSITDVMYGVCVDSA